MSERGAAARNKQQVFRMTGERRQVLFNLLSLAENHILNARDLVEAGEQTGALIALESAIMDYMNLRATLKNGGLPE